MAARHLPLTLLGILRITYCYLRIDPATNTSASLTSSNLPCHFLQMRIILRHHLTDIIHCDPPEIGRITLFARPLVIMTALAIRISS